MPGAFKEPPCLFRGPPAALALARRGQPDHCRRVASDDLFLDGTGERGTERVTGVFPAAGDSVS